MSIGASRRGKYGRRQAVPEKRNWFPLIVLVVGTVLLGGGLLLYLSDSSAAGVSLDYAQQDVANSQPIIAVHEMGQGAASIPFLPRNGPQPKISVPQKTHNFGTIGPKDVVEQEFIIRNTGDAPLTISRAYTTCGCTTAEISASIIEPGEVATVRLVFDAGFHDASGQTVRRGLIIENNDPQNSQTEIWVQAAVRSN